jgi:integrase
MTAPPILVCTESVTLPAPLGASVEAFRQSAKASNTWRAYRADWDRFAEWCARRGRAALPATPETIAWYLAENASELKGATLQRRLSSISKAHQTAGYPWPGSRSHSVVKETWKGIRRAKGVAQTAKSPLHPADLRRIARDLPSGLAGVRDRTLLLLGFAGAFRRSELVALNAEDLDFREDGLVITLRRSKTDQEAAGREIGIPYGSDPATCPVRAGRNWLKVSAIATGPLFRSVDRFGTLRETRLTDKSVALIVKRHAERIGKDVARFSGHSLRTGLVTAAALVGASEHSIMAQTGHRTTTMVRRYIRACSLFQDNAAARTGL